MNSVIAGLELELVFKPIKHLYLRIDPKTGDLKISAPIGTQERSIERFVREKYEWIRARQNSAKQNAKSLWNEQSTQVPFQGQIVSILPNPQTQRALYFPAQSAGDAAVLEVPLDLSKRKSAIDQFYRAELNSWIARCAPEWEEKLGVHAHEYRVRSMRTRWGSCNIRAKRVWLNLWLAEKPIEQAELVLVHELAHLIEPSHSARFYAILDKHLPDWRERDKALNRRG